MSVNKHTLLCLSDMKAANLKTICEVIGNGLRHQDYKHTVDYADNLRNISIAREESVEKLLRQVVRRESDDDFKQRVIITRLLTRALWNRLRTPFNKALRLDNANITMEKEEKELHDAFYGKTPLYKYLRENYHPISFFDPNAHQVIGFEKFDNNTEKAKLRPEIVMSDDSLYFEYDTDQLKVFVCRYGSGYKLFHHGSIDENDQMTNDGNGIVAVEINETAAVDWKVDMNYVTLIGDENAVRDENSPVLLKIGDKYWKFIETEPKISGIQVKRIGYCLDTETNNRTMISPIDPAIPRIEGTIKSKSELDISLAMHCFPQKIQLVDSCRGWKNPDNGNLVKCNGGVAFGTNNEPCKNCGGTGDEPISKTGMDVILVRMGKNKDEDHLPSDMVHYAKPDIDTPKFLDEYLIKQEQLCFQDLFPENPRGERNGAKTATEIKIDEGNMSDAIMPCVRQFESMWNWAMHTGLNIRDINEPKANMRFPDDIDIKTLGELIEDWKQSEGLPVSVRKSIRKKIANKLSVGDNKTEKLEAIRIMHEPFIDKSSADIKYIFSQNYAKMDQRILWANYDEIMSACEKKNEDSWVNFSFDKQRLAIMTEVALIKAGLETEFKPDVVNA